MKTMTHPAAPGHAAARWTAGPAVAGLVYVAAWVAGPGHRPGQPRRHGARHRSGQDVHRTARRGNRSGPAHRGHGRGRPGGGGPDTGPGRPRPEVPQDSEKDRSGGPGGSRAVTGPVRPRGTPRRLGHARRRWLPGGQPLPAHQPHRRGEDALALDPCGIGDDPGPPGQGAAAAAGLPPRSADSRTGRRGFGYLLLSPALAWLAYVSLPLMLIWVAGMGLWLSQGPAVSQANHGQRPANREPGDRCLPQLPPAEAGHSPYPGAFRTPEADQSRADGLSHRQLRASATDVKLPVAGHQPEPVRPGGCAARGLVTVPTAGLQGGSQGSGRRPGASARAVARTIRPVMAMSIPSPSLLRDRSTPAGDSETKRPPPDPTGGGQSGAAAAAMPSRPPTASSLTRARRNTQ